MSLLKQEDSKKWLHSLLAVSALLVGYSLNAFLEQLGEWFELEAKISHFDGAAQGISVFVALVTFIVIAKSKPAMVYLEDVYRELLKVTWSDRDSTFKLTIGILVGLIITSIVLGAIDYGVGKLFGLLYR